jgi:hypothetical protein
MTIRRAGGPPPALPAAYLTAVARTLGSVPLFPARLG